ncbi:MAG TPA: penicillin-binding transpeptidase domain-containing protein, partial [Actinopolymorphaceae bacterium]
VIGHLGTPDGDDAAALLDEAGPAFLPTDEIGLSGLQRTFQRELAGRPGGRIELYEPATGDVTHRLVEMKPRAGTPVKTTLSLEIQTAAESAVVGAEKPTAVVAVRSSTGEILAAAGGPGVTPFNRGFEGKYPPGSTFKVLTAATLLENGMTINDRVTCPATVSVGGKRFTNAGDQARPDGPFVDAFAHSCNSTIVARAESVTGDDLTAMAQRFGIGEKWDLGLPAFSGSVPDPGDLVDRAATMIGQGRVLTSPLGMAMVAAAVESGRPRTPTLLTDRRSRPLAALSPELRRDLTALMRAVVTRGSARQVLSGVPGAIHAKTGTAEYVAGNGIRTHAWMIGFRDDLAFAVVIEDGGAGGKDAGPIARRFLQSVG